MASTPVHVLAPSGLTLTLELYPEGSDTIANGAGDTLTEQTNRKGVYVATVTEALSGRYYAIVKDGSANLIANGAVDLADTTAVCLVEDTSPSKDEIAQAVADYFLFDPNGYVMVDMEAITGEQLLNNVWTGFQYFFDVALPSKTIEQVGGTAPSVNAIATEVWARAVSALTGTETTGTVLKDLNLATGQLANLIVEAHAKIQQLQLTGGLVQVVLHDATSEGLAKWVTVDTGEIAAGDGSVAQLSQGDGGGAGLSGPNVVTITVVDDLDDSPIEGASVRLFRTGETGTLLTDASGQAVFAVESATFTTAVAAAGYEGQSVPLVVGSDVAIEYRLDANGAVLPPAAPGLCNVLVNVIDQHGNPVEGATVTARLNGKQEFASQSLVANASTESTTGVDGIAVLVLIRSVAFNTSSGEYRIHVKYEKSHSHFDYIVPDLDSIVAYLPLT